MRHISLDFWNTVGAAPASYGLERTYLLADFFGVTFDVAKATYKQVKDHFDDADERTGSSFTRDENFIALFRAFNRVPVRGDLDTLMRMMDGIFHRCPPVIAPALREQLLRAHAMGITLSIGSNTNFIMGSEIREILAGIPFAFMVFSDEVHVSKPHPHFFDIVAKEVKRVRPDIKSRVDMLHVGDNMACDVRGAKAAGIPARLVLDANNTAEVISGMLDGVMQASAA